MPVFDTSFLIDLQRGHPRVDAALAKLVALREPLIVTSQVATEYLSGVEDRAVALHMIESGFHLAPRASTCSRQRASREKRSIVVNSRVGTTSMRQRRLLSKRRSW